MTSSLSIGTTAAIGSFIGAFVAIVLITSCKSYRDKRRNKRKEDSMPYEVRRQYEQANTDDVDETEEQDMRGGRRDSL